MVDRVCDCAGWVDAVVGVAGVVALSLGGWCRVWGVGQSAGASKVRRPAGVLEVVKAVGSCWSSLEQLVFAPLGKW